MTEKRFYMDKSGDLWDRQSNDLLMQDFGYCEAIYVNAILDLLNGLYEENEQLKSALKELKEIGDYQADRIQELNDENEQLKQQLELYQELYPSGKWICDLNSDELKKELGE